MALGVGLLMAAFYEPTAHAGGSFDRTERELWVDDPCAQHWEPPWPIATAASSFCGDGRQTMTGGKLRSMPTKFAPASKSALLLAWRAGAEVLVQTGLHPPE